METPGPQLVLLLYLDRMGTGVRLVCPLRPHHRHASVRDAPAHSRRAGAAGARLGCACLTSSVLTAATWPTNVQPTAFTAGFITLRYSPHVQRLMAVITVSSLSCIAPVLTHQRQVISDLEARCQAALRSGQREALQTAITQLSEMESTLVRTHLFFSSFGCLYSRSDTACSRPA